MNPQLINSLKRLRLSGILNTLQLRVQEATVNQLGHLEFLELVLQDEITLRNDHAFAKRIKAAGFRENKSLEDFDFSFNTSVKRKQILELATGHFIHQHQDLLFLGPPGVGKSHLAQALGRQAAKTGFAVFYRSIFFPSQNPAIRDELIPEAAIQHSELLQSWDTGNDPWRYSRF